MNEEQVLKKFLMTKLRGAKSYSEHEIRSFCPNPLHQDSSHPNFFFNVKKKVGFCHTRCGAYTLSQLCQDLDLDLTNIITGNFYNEDLIDYENYEELFVDNNLIKIFDPFTKILRDNIKSQLQSVKTHKIKKVIKYDKNNFKLNKKAKNYLEKRGFKNPEILEEKFDVGYQKYLGFDTIIFPCFYKKDCIYIQRRNFSNKGPRYFNEKLDKTDVVWGLDYLKPVNYVILCEGIFTALTWLYLGYNAVALLGTNISKKQLYHFHKMLKFVNFDLDKPGEKCYNYIKSCYKDEIIDFRFPKFKDPNDFLAKGEGNILKRLIEKKIYG